MGCAISSIPIRSCAKHDGVCLTRLDQLRRQGQPSAAQGHDPQEGGADGAVLNLSRLAFRKVRSCGPRAVLERPLHGRAPTSGPGASPRLSEHLARTQSYTLGPTEGQPRSRPTLVASSWTGLQRRFGLAMSGRIMDRYRPFCGPFECRQTRRQPSSEPRLRRACTRPVIGQAGAHDQSPKRCLAP